MAKGADAFRSIGEVAKLIGVAPHVLRYWETQFTALKPMKRPDGRRYYRPADVDLAAGICVMLRDDGLTIRGARKLIAADRGEAVRARGASQLAAAGPGPVEVFSPPVPEPAMSAPDLPDHPQAEQSPPRQGPALRPRKAAPALPLPLFPDLDAAPQQAVWLARLTELGRHLQQITPDDSRWPQARDTALRLGQAMLRLA